MKKFTLIAGVVFSTAASCNAQVEEPKVQKQVIIKEPVGASSETSVEFKKMRKILKTPLTDLDLSVRTFSGLKKSEIKSIGDLVSKSKEEISASENFDKKSLSELEELVAEKGLSFGMDVSKYNLEED